VSTIRIEHEVEIRRPRADVFAFVSDQDHRPAWVGGVARVRRTSPGPIGAGATYAVVGRALGRRVESNYELIEYEPAASFAGRTSSSVFTIDETYVFEGDGTVTTVRLTADATPGRMLRLLGPLLGLAVERQIRSDHRRLKAILERNRRRPKAPSPKAPSPKAPASAAAAED